MRWFFNLYQYLVPIFLFPTVVFLWKEKIDNLGGLILILGIPIVTSYVIPALGTNKIKLWEFHTKFMIGGFRIQHGFLFGTFTAFFAYLFIDFYKNPSILQILKSGFILGSILGFWNWIYDIYAIKLGIMTVYTQKYTETKDPSAIATDYAPVYFGVFGFIYGCQLQIINKLVNLLNNTNYFLLIAGLMLLIALTVPTLCYMIFSFKRYGQWGLKSYKNFEEKK